MSQWTNGLTLCTFVWLSYVRKSVEKLSYLLETMSCVSQRVFQQIREHVEVIQKGIVADNWSYFKDYL